MQQLNSLIIASGENQITSIIMHVVYSIHNTVPFTRSVGIN